MAVIQKDMFGKKVLTPREEGARDYAVLFRLNGLSESDDGGAMCLRRAEKIRAEHALTKEEIVNAMVEYLGWGRAYSEYRFVSTTNDLARARFGGYDRNMTMGRFETALRCARAKQLPEVLENIALDHALEDAANRGYISGATELLKLQKEYHVQDQRINELIEKHDKEHPEKQLAACVGMLRAQEHVRLVS